MYLQVLRYPNPSLRRPAVKVKVEELLIPETSLATTLAEAPVMLHQLDAVGLAANQLGFPQAWCVIGIPGRKPFVMLNPEITEESDESSFENEGCLSLPGITVEFHRPLRVKVRWQNMNGEMKEEEFRSHGARICCHEIDHLRGGLILDRLSPIKRHKLKAQIAKAIRMEKANINHILKVGPKAVDLQTATSRRQIERLMKGGREL